MAAKVLSVAAALGLLIGSSTIGFAQKSATEPGEKIPEKALMDPKAGVSNEVPGVLTQETGTDGAAAFATAQGTAGPAAATSSGEHQ